MHIDTKCIQSGYTPKSGEPRVLPIYQSTTYKYDSGEQLGQLFDLAIPGHMYTRISNPTNEFVEMKIADLEGGVGAMLTSSGQSASLLAVLNICNAGDNFVAVSAIYGGTVNLFASTLKRLGIEVTFVSPYAEDTELDAAVNERTRLVFGEVLTNPSLDILDIERFANFAHRHNIPLIVDNTFPTPVLCRPIEYGADIVTHSTSKYMDGHATVVGGVIVDSGNFDWTCGKFPELTTPDPTYHGLVYAETFGKAAYITKARVQLMRDLGTAPSPLSTFLLNHGLETLHLRMERHSSNALAVAEFLEKDPRIESVNYPGLKSSKIHHLAEKYLKDGCSGVVSFGLKAGKEAAMKFMNNLKLAGIVVHVADARTCILHPASTTHRQLTDEQLVACGVLPNMVRMSIGIENPKDIIDDIKQALDSI